MPNCYAKAFAFFKGLIISFIINGKIKMVRIAGLEPAKALFSVFPASDVNGVLLPFIAQRVSNIILYLQALFGIKWHL
jgi:hypothetical protein